MCDGTTVYAPGDIVSFEGSAWVVKNFAIGGCVNPPNSPWHLLGEVKVPLAIVRQTDVLATPSVTLVTSTLGPSIYSADTTSCGYVPGQLTTTSSCTVGACQERPTDDRSTEAAPCPDGTSTSFASSSPHDHFACPAGKVDFGFACCDGCPGIIACFGCVPTVKTHTTYNVCFNCRRNFPALGKLVK